MDVVENVVDNFNQLNLPDGLIKSLYLRNFLTYSDCKIVFEPGLNIIFGPNGTGKSSIVCAICLGLCGSPKILGRAKDLQDFIQHGHNDAQIVIELYYNGSIISIKRIISTAAVKKSQWLINNNAVLEKNVLELVGKLGIDMSNLCNFLPQDRVSDFFKMNPQELLIALEETIQNQDIRETHLHLCKIFKEKKTLEDSFNQKNQELSRLKQRNDVLSEEVKRYENWRVNKIQLKLCEQKLCWKKYEDSRLEYTSISKTRKEAESEHSALERSLDPKKREIIDCEKKMKQQKKNLDQLESELSNSSNISSKIHSTISVKSDEIKGLQVVLDEIGNLKAKNTQRIHDCEEYARSLQSDHDKMSQEVSKAVDRCAEIDLEIAQEMKNYYAIEETVRNYNAEHDDLIESLQRSNRDLKELENNKHRLLEIIRNKDQDTFKAIEWANRNRSRFTNEVPNPLLLQIVLNNSDDAKYLESHIQKRDLFAFIFSHKGDYDIFLQEVRENMRLRINAILLTDTSVPEKKRPDLSKYGLRCYLEDIFTCPDSAYSYLCQTYMVNSIPIFNELSDTSLETLTSGSGINTFFTHNEKYMVKISNYSHKPSTQSFKIRANQHLLSKGATQNEIERLKFAISSTQQKIEKIKSHLSENKAKLESIKAKIEELKSQKKSYGSLKTKLKVLETQIKTKLRDAESLKNLVEQSAEDVAKKSKEVTDLLSEVCTLCHSLASKTKNNDTVISKLEKQYIVFFWLVYQHRMLSVELQEAQTLISTQTEHLESLRLEEGEKKTRTKKLFDEAKKASGLGDNDKLSNSTIKKFSELPDEIVDLNNKIVELGALNAAARDFDPTTIQKYDDINKRMAALTESADSNKIALENLKEKEVNLKNIWLEEIKNIISSISQKFSQFLEKMKCKGSIQLNEEENGNYEKYSLNIMVSHRPEDQPVPLSHLRHSGGEKSVATMLFLMAIQQLSKSPFKIVDEINQGMDAHNERAVFEIMVNTVSKCASQARQYFFLSPKVLPDLSYNEDLTVHIVFNGPYVAVKRKASGVAV